MRKSLTPANLETGKKYMKGNVDLETYKMVNACAIICGIKVEDMVAVALSEWANSKPELQAIKEACNSRR